MISIVQKPQKFTPSENPIIFNISSSISRLVYFGVKVFKEDDSLIANQKYYKLPSLTNGSILDLSVILKNLVDHQIINSPNIIEPIQDITASYKLEITEYHLRTLPVGDPEDNLIISGTTITTDLFNVFNSHVARVPFTDFDYKNYVITHSGNTTQFLTNKPKTSNIYKNNIEFLHLLNDGTDSLVKFDFYGADHTLLGSHALSGITSVHNAYRINIDTSVLSSYFGEDFNNIYGNEFGNMFDTPFGSYADVNSSNYFTVQIVDASGSTKSELRTYILKNEPCNKSFQLFFTNNLGGIDNIELFNPKETINNTKTSFQSYQYKVDESGLFTDLNNGIYNSSNKVINSNSKSTYKAITGVLSDDNAKWIKDIIEANQVYTRVANGNFLPVTLVTNNYNIQSRRYSSNNNRLEIEFTTPESGLFD